MFHVALILMALVMAIIVAPIYLIVCHTLTAEEAKELAQSVAESEIFQTETDFDIYFEYDNLQFDRLSRTNAIGYKSGKEEFAVCRLNGKWTGYQLNAEEDYALYMENEEIRITHFGEEETIESAEAFQSRALSLAEEFGNVVFEQLKNAKYESCLGFRNRFTGEYYANYEFFSFNYTIDGVEFESNHMIVTVHLNEEQELTSLEIRESNMQLDVFGEDTISSDFSDLATKSQDFYAAYTSYGFVMSEEDSSYIPPEEDSSSVTPEEDLSSVTPEEDSSSATSEEDLSSVTPEEDLSY